MDGHNQQKLFAFPRGVARAAVSIIIRRALRHVHSGIHLSRPLALCLLLVLPLTAHSQEFGSMEARYLLYSGAIGDPMPVEQNNAKLALAITGDAAEEIFQQIGPDLKDECDAGNESRFRANGNGSVACQYHLQDGYLCYLGIDLVKGMPVSASVC